MTTIEEQASNPYYQGTHTNMHTHTHRHTPASWSGPISLTIQCRVWAGCSWALIRVSGRNRKPCLKNTCGERSSRTTSLSHMPRTPVQAEADYENMWNSFSSTCSCIGNRKRTGASCPTFPHQHRVGRNKRSNAVS